MEKIHFPRKFRVYLPLIILYVVLVFLLPKTSKFNYDYKKGEPWVYETLTAQFDFPILKTELQLLQEYKKVSSSVIPYYRHDSAVESRAQLRLQSMDLGEYSGMKSRISSVLYMAAVHQAVCKVLPTPMPAPPGSWPVVRILSSPDCRLP